MKNMDKTEWKVTSMWREKAQYSQSVANRWDTKEEPTP